MNLKRTKKQWQQYNINALASLSNEAIIRDMRDAKHDIQELHKLVKQLNEMVNDKSNGSLRINA